MGISKNFKQLWSFQLKLEPKKSGRKQYVEYKKMKPLFMYPTSTNQGDNTPDNGQGCGRKEGKVLQRKSREVLGERRAGLDSPPRQETLSTRRNPIMDSEAFLRNRLKSTHPTHFLLWINFLRLWNKVPPKLIVFFKFLKPRSLFSFCKVLIKCKSLHFFPPDTVLLQLTGFLFFFHDKFFELPFLGQREVGGIAASTQGGSVLSYKSLKC